MELESLINAASIIENNKCNGWWHEKKLNFNIQSKDNNQQFFCHNLSNENTEHLMWNNKRVCLKCICIGNRLYALNFFFTKIIIKFIETNPLIIINKNFKSFISILEKKLKNISLEILSLPIVYTVITNIYKSFFKDIVPILNAITNFENIYHPNVYNNKYLTKENEQYLSMRKLLENSK